MAVPWNAAAHGEVLPLSAECLPVIFPLKPVIKLIWQMIKQTKINETSKGIKS